MLVAAAITPRGLCGRLLEAALGGRWQPVVSPHLLAELDAVLAREKFRRWLSEDEARRFVADVGVLAEITPDPPSTSGRATADPKDEFLVALVVAAPGIVALISGDPHLTELVDMNPPVLTPARFLDQIRGWATGPAGPQAPR